MVSQPHLLVTLLHGFQASSRCAHRHTPRKANARLPNGARLTCLFEPILVILM